MVDSKSEEGKQSFDIVIDSSVTDVFIAGKMRVSDVQDRMKSFLKPGGMFVAMSMNHRPWIKLMGSRYPTFYYSSIEQWSGSARNPRNLRRDVACIVAFNFEILDSDSQKLIESLPVHPLMNRQGTGLYWFKNPETLSNLTFVSSQRT